MPPPQCHSVLRLGLGAMSNWCWHSLEVMDKDKTGSSIEYLRALPDMGVSWCHPDVTEVCAVSHQEARCLGQQPRINTGWRRGGRGKGLGRCCP